MKCFLRSFLIVATVFVATSIAVAAGCGERAVQSGGPDVASPAPPG